MELLLLKLIMYVVAIVAPFLIGVFVLFAVPYAFFMVIRFLFVDRRNEDGWIAKFCDWGMRTTWKVQRLFLPYGIVLMLGTGKK